MKTFAIALLLSSVSALGTSICDPLCAATESCATKTFYSETVVSNGNKMSDPAPVGVCVVDAECYDTATNPAKVAAKAGSDENFSFTGACNTLGQKAGPNNHYSSEGLPYTKGLYSGTCLADRACTDASHCCGDFKCEEGCTDTYGSSSYCGDGMGADSAMGVYYSGDTFYHTCSALQLVASAGSVLAASYLI